MPRTVIVTADEVVVRFTGMSAFAALKRELRLSLGAIRSVSVGDARSRWGSCSASGAIRYNWRIILAPPHLLRWLVAHEVAHRVHLNHGPAFKALEAGLYGGDVAAARAELRALGLRLKRVGRPL